MKELAETCLFALFLALIFLILMFTGIIIAKDGLIGVAVFAVIFGFIGTIAAILSSRNKKV